MQPRTYVISEFTKITNVDRCKKSNEDFPRPVVIVDLSFIQVDHADALDLSDRAGNALLDDQVNACDSLTFIRPRGAF